MQTPRNIEELDDLVSRPTGGAMAAVEAHAGDFAVLGAGGKMGFHLTLMLQRALKALGRNDRLIAVSRFGSKSGRAPFEERGIETISADLCDAESLQQLPDVENVFFLAGVKFGTSNDSGLLQKMNIDMPTAVAKRFKKSRIVALSTGCVYSFMEPESEGPTEEDETAPPGEYAESCLGREQAFVAGSKKHGTLSTLVRLNYAVDLRYGVLVDIAQKILADQPVDVEMGYLNLIWQGDALAHIIQCLGVADSPPAIRNISRKEILRVRDLAEQLGKRLGREPNIVGTEAPTAWITNPSKSHEEFGAPKTSLDQILDWTAEWLLAEGETLGKPTHFENRDGKY
ncbi:MAG: NAD(P)-dependent oxidoreductase [Verrucomicrobiota bacterium]